MDLPVSPVPRSSQAGPSNVEGPSKDKVKRAFKACAHCRSRKAKCDLGELSNPSLPPCARCRREGVVCEFLPSKRGGRIPFLDQIVKEEENASILAPPGPNLKRTMEARGDGTGHASERIQTLTNTSHGINYHPYSMFPSNQSEGPLSSTSKVSGGQTWLQATTSLTPHFSARNFTSSYLPSTSQTLSPIISHDVLQLPHFSTSNPIPASDGSPHSDQQITPSESTGNSSLNLNSVSTNLHRNKRRKDDAEMAAAASLRNPVDALDLLVMAAKAKEVTDGVAGTDKGDTTSFSSIRDRAYSHGSSPGTTKERHSNGEKNNTRKEPIVSPPSLSTFPLIKNKILTVNKLIDLVDIFFSRIHFVFPIVPYNRIPKTEQQVAKFASEELHLTTVIVVIASRNEKDMRIHDRSWAYMQTLISQIMLGKCYEVGATEALLLLSGENFPMLHDQFLEFLPHQAEYSPTTIHTDENRMSWMLVGTAVRLGYMLGLDVKGLEPARPLAPDGEPMSKADEIFNRERVCWTYCYLFDRQISIRTGRGFWSRGPSLCFSGATDGVFNTAARNFPSLRFIPNAQDDFASLIQAYVELTQLMTSVHDILYPSRERTIALVKMGEYYKYIDEFKRSLEAFRKTWEGKVWGTYPLTEVVWITFHYLRLYIHNFAFQASVQRATLRSESNKGDEDSRVFPAGLMASPDAKHILEAIDAATDLLRLVTDRLHPGGALIYLPSRFFMFCAYGGVFLLKAVYTEAVAKDDRLTIVNLLTSLIKCLAAASNDEQHPGVRYARLLTGLLRTFNKGDGSGMDTRANPTPMRRNSDPPRPQFTKPEFGLPAQLNTALSSLPFTPAASGSMLYPPTFDPSPQPEPAFAFNAPSPLPFSNLNGNLNVSTPSTSLGPLPKANGGLGNESTGLQPDLNYGFDNGLVADDFYTAGGGDASAYSFLSEEDAALDFWQSFSNPQ